jgi:hypothetical protein
MMERGNGFTIPFEHKCVLKPVAINIRQQEHWTVKVSKPPSSVGYEVSIVASE